MSSRVVLVTGVGGEFGSRLLSRLGNNPRFERVVGIDTTPPEDMSRQRMGIAEFVRADIRNPLIAKIVESTEADTVVHASTTAHPPGPGTRAAIKEVNAIGTMRLLAACQHAPRVRKLVVKSTAAVYGAAPRAPAVFTEDDELLPAAASGYGKDAVEVEGYVRGFARRRPDVTVTVLRPVNLLGHDVDTVLNRYFALPVVPTVLGYDARLQLLHPADSLAVFETAVAMDRPGVFNLAGEGTLTVSQALRRAGRTKLPMPRIAVPSLGRVLRGTRLVDFSTEQLRLLNYGRLVDTTRLRHEFGYNPRWSTAEVFDDYLTGRGMRPVMHGERLTAAVEGVFRAATPPPGQHDRGQHDRAKHERGQHDRG